MRHHVAAQSGRSIATAMLGSIVVFATVMLLWPRQFPLDDAYTTLHNARSLLEGSDPLFGVNPLVGATSSVHLACVAALGWLIPLPSAALAVSAICTMTYAWGLWRLHPRWPFVIIGLCAGYIPVHLLNGLETSMALAAVVWSLVLADSKWVPLLLGLMPFIRPDLLFLAAPLMVRTLGSNPSRSLGLAFASAAPFALWNQLALGMPFPNTAVAKIAFFGESQNPPLAKMYAITTALTMSFILPLCVGALGLMRVRAGWCGLVYVVSVLTAGFFTLPGAFFWNDFRYLAPFVPILAYGVTAFQTRLLVWLAVASIVTGSLAAIRLQNALEAIHDWFDAAAVISRLPPGSTVLVHDIGVVAWTNPPVRLVDVVGLKTPSSEAAMTRNHVRAEHWGAALDQIARQSGAQYAVVLNQPFWRSIGTNLRDDGWTLSPIAQQAFTVYRIAPPTPGRPGAKAGALRLVAGE